MTTTFDEYIQRVEAGGQLSPDEIRELAATPDILPLGMLADALRRRINGTRVTFLRVAACAFDKSFADAVPVAAREIRITGAPESLSIAITAVQAARAVAADRTVAGFSWADIERFGNGNDGGAPVLEQLRAAGLDALAELPLDAAADPSSVVQLLMRAGFTQLRLTIARAPAGDRVDLLLRAGELQKKFAGIQTINPLPTTLHAFRPTTGYDDVKMVAIARLAAPNIPVVQVDWPRYGPKLAQVALTFGADDIYGVSGSDDAPEGRRRAPLEDIRRNIEAAGFEPAERDGRFNVIA